nr:PREDICTED: (-)-isopiperitenol/(-)-carveol dehydrogenase, mitochondrial-like [Daucus carota subsp. sativus]
MNSSILGNKKLEGKVVIITGGASGIGEATARHFADHGAQAVVIADLQEEKGLEVAFSIGYCCTFIKCDVTDEQQVTSLVDSTVKAHGKLDIMFSNAGVLSMSSSEQSILEFDLEASDKLFAVNVRGMIACVKHAARAMVECGVKGSIVCTSSAVANTDAARPIDYVLSKQAVVGLVRCASRGLGEHGIRVNCVSPGPIGTPLMCNWMHTNAEGIEKAFESMNFLKGGVLKLRNVADAVLFLACEDSQFVTGHNLVVDAASSSSNVALWESWKPEKGAKSPSLSDVVWPCAGAFAAMAALAKIDQVLASKGLFITIAPLGAVCAVLFATPSSPGARKYNMFMAQIGCAAIGVLAFSVFGPGWLARSAGLAAAIAFMILTGAVHPPAASLPILFIDVAKMQQLNFWYALFPGAAGCILLCLIQEVVMYLKNNFKF